MFFLHFLFQRTGRTNVLYSAHYESLIARARTRALVGYSERHHVVPRCMGGDDAPGNIVELTAEEHYVAHQLLVKMHPWNAKLVYAARRMTHGNGRGNKLYGWLRRRFSKAKSAEMRGKKYALGKKFSAETRAKMSASRRGVSTGPRSPECRAKISEALHRRVVSQATRSKMSASRRGRASPWLGRAASPETRAKMSAAQLARQARQRNEQIVNFH